MGKVIDAVIKLQDSFSPTLKSISGNLSTFNKHQREVSRSISNTGYQISSMSKKIAALSAPILAAATAGLATLKDLNKEADRVGAAVGIPAEGMKQLRKEALETSNATGVAIDKVQAAQVRAIYSDVALADNQEFIARSIGLARLAGLDEAETTKQMGTAAKAYCMNLQDLNYLNDQLITGARIANTDLAQFAPAFLNNAKAAADAGIGQQQYIAALDMLIKRGTDAQAAASGLAAMFDAMAKPSAKARKIIDELGLSFDSAHVQAVGLPGLLREIQDATGGDEAVISKIIPDINAYKLALQLASDDGMSEYNGYLKQVMNTQGQFNSALEQFNNSSGQKTARALNELKNDAIQLAVNLAPLLKAAKNAAVAFNSWFNGLSEEGKKSVLNFAEIAISIGIVGTVVGGAIGKFGKMYKGISKFVGMTAEAGGVVKFFGGKLGSIIPIIRAIGLALKAAFLSPIGIVIAAIALLAYVVYNNCGGCRDAFMKMWSKITAIFTTHSAKIEKIMNALKVAWEIIWPYLTQCADNFLTSVGIILGTLFNVLGDVIDFISAVFAGDWAGAWEAIKNIFTDICDGIGNYFKLMIDGIADSVSGLADRIAKITGGSGHAAIQQQVEQGLDLPGNAAGTNNWRGGLTRVNERGGEIMNLPRGTQIIPHDKSIAAARAQGQQDAGRSVSINIPKLADSIVVRSESDIDKITDALVFKLKGYAINATQGAL